MAAFTSKIEPRLRCNRFCNSRSAKFTEAAFSSGVVRSALLSTRTISWDVLRDGFYYGEFFSRQRWIA